MSSLRHRRLAVRLAFYSSLLLSFFPFFRFCFYRASLSHEKSWRLERRQPQQLTRASHALCRLCSRRRERETGSSERRGRERETSNHSFLSASRSETTDEGSRKEREGELRTSQAYFVPSSLLFPTPLPPFFHQRKQNSASAGEREEEGSGK